MIRLAARLRRQRHVRRLRTALGPAPVLDDEARGARLRPLVAAQLEPWRERRPPQGAAARERLLDLSREQPGVVVFELAGGRLDVWPKPRGAARPATEDDARMYGKRTAHYATLFAEVLRHWPGLPAMRVAVDLNDIPMRCDDWPVHGFQKATGAHTLLLPDVDFFHHGWYLDEHDPLAYLDKSCTACFVGSSTGASLGVEEVRRHASPRLALAQAFHGQPRVVFSIANAAHCTSEEARRLLMAQPWFTAPVGWGEQLRHRFLISVDGNGATCSRVVKSLRSQGVLVKFESDQQLFYFPLLRAGEHYLPARHPQDVLDILDLEAERPGHHQRVSRAGQAFAARFLTAEAVLQYTHLLLREGAALSPA